MSISSEIILFKVGLLYIEPSSSPEEFKENVEKDLDQQEFPPCLLGFPLATLYFVDSCQGSSLLHPNWPLSCNHCLPCQTPDLTSPQMPLSALSRPPRTGPLCRPAASMMITSELCKNHVLWHTSSWLYSYPLSISWLCYSHTPWTLLSVFWSCTPDWWSKDYRLLRIYQASLLEGCAPQLLLDVGCEPSAPPQYTPNSAKYYFPHITLTTPNLG